LRDTTVDDPAGGFHAHAHAHLALAQILVRQDDHDEARPHAEAVLGTAIAPDMPVPQGRVVFRSAATLLHLRVSDSDAQVASLLVPARADVSAVQDLPALRRPRAR
jgi:hypothetical protein